MGALEELATDDQVDLSTFEQILEMDDDDEREFSREIVLGFFDQAEQTFNDIQEKLQEKDLDRLSALGHYLKGSSATLGLIKMRDSCEKIQHFGSLMDEEGVAAIEPEVALEKIGEMLKALREDYAVIEKRFKSFYNVDMDED